MHPFFGDTPPTPTLPLKRGGSKRARMMFPPLLRGRAGWGVSAALIVVMMALSVPHAWGQAKDPVALAKAKELLTVSNLASFRDQMTALVQAQIAALVLDANPGLDDKVDDAVKDLIQPALKKRMPEYLELAAAVYADHFTRNEIEQLLAFYKSPLGQKLMREQDKLVPAMTEMAKKWVNKVGNEVLKETSADLAKRGLKAPGA